jgi:hypothetical protein
VSEKLKNIADEKASRQSSGAATSDALKKKTSKQSQNDDIVDHLSEAN